jgi:hypothetical protein
MYLVTKNSTGKNGVKTPIGTKNSTKKEISKIIAPETPIGVELEPKPKVPNIEEVLWVVMESLQRFAPTYPSYYGEKKIPYRITLKNELKNKNEIRISNIIINLLIDEEIGDVYKLCETEIDNDIKEKENLILKIKKDKKDNDRDNFLPVCIYMHTNIYL